MVSLHAFSLRASFVLEPLRRQHLCKMDAFDIQGCQGLNEESVMYLDCFCDLSFTIPSLPFLRLNGVLCHFSFLDSPLEKRMCVQINFYFKTLMTNVGCVIFEII